MIRHLILAAALGLAAAPVAAAQQTGAFAATCTLQGQAAPMQMQYTRYRDVAVWQGEQGVGSEAVDMQQWGPTHWEGVIDTQFGRYRLTGENQFIEAWPEGGVYSDMITLEITQTSETTFTLRDYFNNGPLMPCEVTGFQ